MNARLEPLWVLFREFSSLRVIYASTDPLGICRAAPPRPILPLAGAARQRGGRAQDLWTCTEASPLEAHGCGVARTSERGRYRPKWRGPLGRAACSKADRPLPAKIAHSVSRPSSMADHRLSDYAQGKRVCRPSVPGRTPVASGWLELASTCSPSQACLIARGSKRLLLARGHERFVVCCAAGAGDRPLAEPRFRLRFFPSCSRHGKPDVRGSKTGWSCSGNAAPPGPRPRRTTMKIRVVGSPRSEHDAASLSSGSHQGPPARGV